MIDILLAPFAFPFMQNAFLIAIMVAVPTALLSCFLVLKGWALMGDAVSHAVLPGVVLAYVLGLPLVLGAFCAGMVTALASGYLTENSRVKSDSVMGIVFSGMFGLGIVLYVWISPSVHLDHILFGNILGVGKADLQLTLLIALPVSLILLLSWKDLMLLAFDPTQALASGLRVGLLHYGLLTILSSVIVATMTATGLILAVGLLIAPGAIAFLLTRRFGQMLWVSVLVCLGAMLGGVWASFYLDSAPAPTIMLLFTCLFVLALGWKSLRQRQSQAQI